MGTTRKQRRLTKAEQRRLDRFRATSEELLSQGYRQVDLRVSMVWANVLALAAFVVLGAGEMATLGALHHELSFSFSGVTLILPLVVLVVLIVLHELIHGLTWSRFTRHGFGDIEFGVMWNTLSPYCTCTVPLQRGAYVLGGLAPLVVLGPIPLVIALIAGSIPLAFVGVVMTACAMGDVMAVCKVLSHKSASEDTLWYDHPTECGVVVFER